MMMISRTDYAVVTWNEIDVEPQKVKVHSSSASSTNVNAPPASHFVHLIPLETPGKCAILSRRSFRLSDTNIVTVSFRLIDS
jgi:hypothetical protein